MPAKRNENLKDEDIFRLYFEEGWGTTRIARHLGVRQQAVTHRLVRAGAKMRPRGTGTIPKPTLEKLFLRQNLSGMQIAEKLGVPKDQVYKDLKGHGLWGKSPPSRTTRGSTSWKRELRQRSPHRRASSGSPGGCAGGQGSAGTGSP